MTTTIDQLNALKQAVLTAMVNVSTLEQTQTSAAAAVQLDLAKQALANAQSAYNVALTDYTNTNVV